MKKLTILFIILLCSLLLGCKEPECETDSDCEDKYPCTIDKCIDDVCTHQLQKGCYKGDGKCDKDKGENECTSPIDCGKCEGKEGDYIIKSCNEENECVSMLASLKTESAKEEEYLKAGTKKLAMLNMDVKYDTPFDIAEGYMEVGLSISSKDYTLDKVIIEKIEIKEKPKKRTETGQTYATIELNRPIFSESSGLTEKIPLSGSIDSKGEEKKVSVTVYYSYEYATGGKIETKSGDLSTDFNIVLLRSSEENKCPESCDDSNPCSVDRCSEATGFRCTHEMRKSCRGNYICEQGENRCNAPIDCGACEGEAGKYSIYSCQNGQCVITASPDSLETKSLVKEFSPGSSGKEVKFNVKSQFKNPFSIGTDSFQISFDVLSISDEIDNFKINSVQLLEGTNLLGDSGQISQGFSSVGQARTIEIIPQISMAEVEDTKRVELKIFYSYTLEEGDESKDYTNKDSSISLGQVIFLSAGES